MRSMLEWNKVAVVEAAHAIIGPSSLSSESTPRAEISAGVKPVIVESVILTEAPVALNHPGNFSMEPLLIASRLFAPETVNASFRYGLIAVVCVVTNELTRMRAPPAFTFRAYPEWAASLEKFKPPLMRVRLPPALMLIEPSTL